MAESSIEWTDKTWNPVSGCTRASAGCDHCYAVTMTHRLEAMGKKKYAGLTVLNGKGDRHFNGQVRVHEDALIIPQEWKKPARIFVNSMSDLFHKDVPFEFVDKVFAVMALCPQHTFQVLTKRLDRMATYFSIHKPCGHQREPIGDLLLTRGAHSRVSALAGRGLEWPLPNVWLGASVENQEWANDRIPHLLRVPAAVRFLSMEPLLGPVEFSYVGKRNDCLSQLGRRALGGIDWVIVGGESGHGTRPFNIAWARSIIAQCKAAGVAVFVKQLGSRPVEFGECDCGRIEHGRCHQLCPSINPQPINLRSHKGGDWSEWPADLRVREFPRSNHDQQ